MDRDAGKVISEAIGHHSTDIFDIKRHVTFLKLYFVSSALYFSLIMVIKVSILLMYRRIFSVDALFRLQSLLLGVVVLAFWLATSIARVCSCRPIGYVWMGLDFAKHCFDYDAFWVTVGTVEVVIDIAILVLPVRMVLRVQLSPKQKASVTIVFLLGGLLVLPFSTI